MDRNAPQLDLRGQLTSDVSNGMLCEDGVGAFSQEELAKLERQLIPMLNTIRAMLGKAPLVSSDKLTA